MHTEQQRIFLEESGLASARPSAHIEFSRPGGYPELLEASTDFAAAARAAGSVRVGRGFRREFLRAKSRPLRTRGQEEHE